MTKTHTPRERLEWAARILQKWAQVNEVDADRLRHGAAWPLERHVKRMEYDAATARTVAATLREILEVSDKVIAMTTGERNEDRNAPETQKKAPRAAKK